MDCGRFLIECLKAGNLAVPTTIETFTKDWHLHCREERYLKIVESFNERVEVPQPGDIVMYRIGRVYSHSGLVIEWPKIIHADWKSGVVLCDAEKNGVFGKRPKLFLSPYALEINKCTSQIKTL